MKGNCCLTVHNHPVRFSNIGHLKQTPSCCQNTKTIFNDASCPAKSVVKYSLILCMECKKTSYKKMYWSIQRYNHTREVIPRVWTQHILARKGKAASPTIMYGNSACVVPGSGWGDREPLPKALPKSELANTPTSLWRPAWSPMSTRMNLQS